MASAAYTRTAAGLAFFIHHKMEHIAAVTYKAVERKFFS